MKKFLTLALVAATMTAWSASFAASTKDWSGPSVGLVLAPAADFSAGGSGPSFDDTSNNARNVWTKTNHDHDMVRPGGGLRLAYNWQTGQYVYGGIVDALYLVNANAKSGALNYGAYSYHRQDQMTWVSTLRARAGLDEGVYLPYVTGGLAMAGIKNIHQTITCCPTLFESNADGTRLGYVLGLGAERRLTPNVSVSFEGLYAVFPDRVGHDVGPNAIAPQSSRVDLKNDLASVNVALDYHF